MYKRLRSSFRGKIYLANAQYGPPFVLPAFQLLLSDGVHAPSKHVVLAPPITATELVSAAPEKSLGKLHAWSIF